MKRKYENKILFRIDKNKTLLINNLENEWDSIQKSINRKEKIEKIIELTKKSGIVLCKTILQLAAIGGILTVVMVAPKIFAAFNDLSKTDKKYKGFFYKKDFNNSIKYLKNKKYIKVIKKDDGTFEIYLEKKGAQKALFESFNDLTIKKQEKWDNLWRIVIFDIPEKLKWGRDGFRGKLKQLNFYQIQESVFVFPYDCKKEVEFLCSIFNISDYVRFIEAKSIIHNSDIIDFYKL